MTILPKYLVKYRGGFQVADLVCHINLLIQQRGELVRNGNALSGGGAFHN